MKRRWMIPALSLCALCARPGAGAAQQYTIDSNAGLPADYRFTYATGMRNASTSTFQDGVLTARGGYGQTFTIGVGSTLLSWQLRTEECRSFSLGTRDERILDPCLFRAYVAGFDGGRLGDVLWQSRPVSYPQDAPYPMRSEVWLDPGVYVAFILQEPTAPTPTYTGTVVREYSYLSPIGHQPSASPGSDWVVLETRDPSLPLSETVWRMPLTEGWNPGDVQTFSATLDSTVTPEPATLTLLGTGLAGLVGAARRRRRKQEEAQG